MLFLNFLSSFSIDETCQNLAELAEFRKRSIEDLFNQILVQEFKSGHHAVIYLSCGIFWKIWLEIYAEVPFPFCLKRFRSSVENVFYCLERIKRKRTLNKELTIIRNTFTNQYHYFKPLPKWCWRCNSHGSTLKFSKGFIVFLQALCIFQATCQKHKCQQHS